METLMSLTRQYQVLLEIAADPDVDPATVQDTMEALDGEIEEKADAYAAIMARLNAESEMIGGEIKRLTAWKKRLDENTSRMKENLLNAMKATGKVKFKTMLHSFSIRKNPASLIMEAKDWRSVPTRYLVERDPDIDTAKLKEDLKAGKELPGIAHLEQTDRVQIS